MIAIAATWPVDNPIYAILKWSDALSILKLDGRGVVLVWCECGGEQTLPQLRHLWHSTAQATQAVAPRMRMWTLDRS